MRRTIAMAVEFPCSAARLYRMYLSPRLHAAFTGAAVRIAPRAGAPFRAFGGALTGSRLIVQTTHINVADGDFAGVSEGWSKYYCLLWRAYLQRRSKKGQP